MGGQTAALAVSVLIAAERLRLRRRHFQCKWVWSAFWCSWRCAPAAYAVLPMVLICAGSLEGDPAQIFSY